MAQFKPSFARVTYVAVLGKLAGPSNLQFWKLLSVFNKLSMCQTINDKDMLLLERKRRVTGLTQIDS